MIAVGRLTNLALALRADPGLATLARRVVVMGGAFGMGVPPGPNGNVTPVAEANVIGDPLAADEVVAASWPVRMVGLDVTRLVRLDRAEIDAMAASPDPAVAFLGRAKGHYAGYHRRFGVEGCYVHDASAVIAALDEGAFRWRAGAIAVAQEGVARGQTIQAVDPDTLPPQPWFGRPHQDVAVSVDAERVRARLLPALGIGGS